MKRDDLARCLINQLPAVPTKHALKSHVGTPADAEERLVDVSALEGDLLLDAAIFGHQEAMPFADVGDGLAIGNFVF
jgi:hypothetical protein